MNQTYNEIFIKELISFFEYNNVSCYFNHQKSIIYVAKSKFYRESYLDYIKKIKQLNIFEPISSFKYGSLKYLIIIENEDLGKSLFNLLLNKFKETDYESLFWSSISKIIPMNFIIDNNWDIASKFLNTKPLRSNGLPSIENTHLFFEILEKYIHNHNFEINLLNFCSNYGTFIKRIESQYHLKKIIAKINKFNDFSKYIKENHNPLFLEQKDFTTFYIDESQLFNYFGELCEDKFEPIKIMDSLVEKINNNKFPELEIHNIFLHQKESSFENIILLVKFNNQSYSFIDFLLFLLKHALENKNNIDIPKVFHYFQLNNKLKLKDNVKQKMTKI